MAAGDLITLAALEQYLSLPAGNTDEVLLAALITAASTAISTYCGRAFLSASYTETRNGTGAKILALANTPVTAVASVSIGIDVVPPGDPNVTPGYFFDQFRLYLNGYSFRRGLQNVSVAYTAGLAVAPADLQEACIELVALRYKERPHFDMISKGNAGETTAFMTKGMKDSTRDVLDRKKRVVPAWP